MKIVKYIIPITFFISLIFIACSDILEEDLREKTITLNSPQNQDTLIDYSVNFWWEELDGATEYRVQIVQGSFTTPISLILDSIFTYSMFDLTLVPGEYEWQVKAVNGSTETPYVKRAFFIFDNDDLSSEQIILKNPSNNNATNKIDLTLSWYLNQKAEDYIIDVKKNGISFIPSIITEYDSAQVSLGEGVFTWSIQGRNTTSISIASAREFTIDTTAPTIPTLIEPLSNALIDTNFIDFSWNQGTSLTDITDTLFIYSDSLQTVLDYYLLSSPNIGVEFVNSGVYYWRVRSVDAAKNNSTYSNGRKFTIN